MKNIIFIAPPAAGKGTQSDLLVKKYGYTHISTGDLLRGEIAKQSEIGKNIKELMDSGNLISDEIVSTLLKNKLISVDGPFILDGYPRDLNQIDILTPKLIITLGEFPTRNLLNFKFDKFKDVVGNIYEVDGYKVLPIYHPSPISPKGYKDNIPIFEKLKNKIFVEI